MSDGKLGFVFAMMIWVIVLMMGVCVAFSLIGMEAPWSQWFSAFIAIVVPLYFLLGGPTAGIFKGSGPWDWEE